MFDASHQEPAEDAGDGTGQGPRVPRGREAAMGATIFVGGNLFPEQKWWGPVVLDAAPKRASCLAFPRERPLPTFGFEARPVRHKLFSYTHAAWHDACQEGTHGQRKER